MKPNPNNYNGITKKKPAKRGDNPIKDKLNDLRHRMGVTIHDGPTCLNDKSFVVELIDNIKNGFSVDRKQMKKCNKLWKQYDI